MRRCKYGRYTLKIELLTDAVFGSGNSVPGFVDADVLHDEYGFLYINGKTLKGNWEKWHRYL